MYFLIVCTLDKDCSSLGGSDIKWFDAKDLQLGCIGFVSLDISSSEAEVYCTSRGYRLVEIYDQNQQDFLKHKANNLGSASEKGYWIGLKRTGSSTWKWLDSGLTPVYNAWGKDQPHNGYADKLANMYPNYDYKWVDLNAIVHKHRNCRPICQKIQGMSFVVLSTVITVV